MLKRLISIILLGVLLSGCSFVQLGTEDLLTPPSLTKDQSEIYDALRSALGTENFKLKYPKRGDYLSAFVFHNLDTDSDLESVVFYELTVNSVSSVWMSILDRSAQGWNTVYDLPLNGPNIDFVYFASISDEEKDNLVLGTSTQGSDDVSVNVYDYNGSKLTALYSGSCAEVLFADVDQNGLEEIVLFTRSVARPAVAKLVKYRSGRIVLVDEANLYSGVTDYFQVRYDTLANGYNAIFVDMIVNGTFLTTQLLSAGDAFITTMSYEEMGIYENFERPLDSVKCADYNGDGNFDIPLTTLLPGYTNQSEIDDMYLTRFMGMKDGKLGFVKSAAINKAGGYMLYFPDGWVNKVTVIPQPESGEWRFVVFNKDLEHSTQELLRIKVVSKSDYQDKFADSNYVLLEKKGALEYYVHLTDSAVSSPLAIEFSRLGDLFTLLTA